MNKKHIKAYQVKCSYHKGENIKFSLLAGTDKALYLAEQLDIFFPRFFKDNQFSQQGWTPHSGNLFSNFPVNTIQYGLYTYSPLITDKDLYKHRFETKLSQLMIMLLGNEPVDEDKIMTLAFYLHIAWLKVHRIYHPELTAEQYTGFYGINRSGTEGDFSTTNLLASYFDNNKDQLIDIYNEIIHQPVTQLPGWLQKWIRICANELKHETKRFPKEGSAEVIFKRIAYMIIYYFGLSHQMQSLLFHSVVTAISTQSQELPC